MPPAEDSRMAEPDGSNGHESTPPPNAAQNPPSRDPRGTGDVSQLLAGFSQAGGGGPSTAADLVAQLSQSGASAQMLLDAISALPQVTESPKKSAQSFTGFMSSGLIS